MKRQPAIFAAILERNREHLFRLAAAIDSSKRNHEEAIAKFDAKDSAISEIFFQISAALKDQSQPLGG